MNAVNTPNNGQDPSESHSRAVAWAQTMHGFGLGDLNNDGFVDVYDESEEDIDSSRGDYSSQPNPNLKPFTARRSEETVITSSSKGMDNKVR